MNTLQLQALKPLPNTAQAFVSLELEPLVDTGNAVPIGITLQAPLETGAAKAFKAFALYAPDNPASELIAITLGSPQQRYQFDTRVRLGASQDIWLVATLTDGRVMVDMKPTVLTSSACFDAS